MKPPAAQIIEPSAQPKAVTIPPSVKVGSVPYLNAKPLTRFIASPVALLEPSRLAADLREGLLDVALVPLVEALDAPAGTYRIVDKLAIGAEREVYSVYLNYTGSLAAVKTVALDPASRTSVELARIVLEKFYLLKPTYVSPDEPADAQVLIGDPAITHRQANPEQNYLDLAGSWREHTGLPFVFAVWAMRKEATGLSLFPGRTASVPSLLRRAGKLGLAWRESIARTPFERDYLTRHLCYDLGAEQKKAIALFGELLAQTGRIATSPKLSYI